MFCPNCKAEYRDGFYICADCDVELVSDLTPRFAPKPTIYEALAPVADRQAYEIIRSHLDAARISYIPDGDLVERLDFPLTIRVRTNQMDLARGLLDELDTSVYPIPAMQERSIQIIPEPKQPEPEESVRLEVEGIVAQNGRYLVFIREDQDGGSVKLPGGCVRTEGGGAGTLEEALRLILRRKYGLEVEDECIYVGSGLHKDESGKIFATAHFLTRWRQGEPGGEGRWMYADDLRSLDLPKGFDANIGQADRIRVYRGW